MYLILSLGTASVLVWSAATEAVMPLRFKDDTPPPHRTIVRGEDVYNYIGLPDSYGERMPFSHKLSGASVDPIAVPDAIITDIASRPITLPIGVTVVLAPTGWGKTVLVESFLMPSLEMSGLSPRVLSYLEPISGTEDERTEHVHTPEALLAEIGVAMMRQETIMVDSLRAFVYGKGRGGTGSRGVDQLLYPQLTALSNLALELGARLIVTLNPMVTLEESARYDEFANSITASVAGALIGTKPRSGVFYDRGISVSSRDDAKINIHVPDRGFASRSAPAYRTEDQPMVVQDPSTPLASNLLARSLNKDN